MLATRATPKQAAEKQRKARKQASSHGKTQRKNTKLRGEWHILLTNIPEGVLSFSSIIELYALRWQIETIFKAWKQSSKLKACFNKESNPNHLNCLIHASLILLALSLRTTMMLQSVSSCWISLRKVAKRLSRHLVRLTDLESVNIYIPNEQQVTFDKRQRKSIMERALLCLS